MSSCLIPSLIAATTASHTPPAPVTEGDRAGLFLALDAIPDPRHRRGQRFGLTSLLAVAVCASIAGATTFAAMADWLADLDPVARARLGFARRIPAATTIWRTLIRLDADLLSTVLARWLRSRVRPGVPAPQRRARRIVIAVDGKSVCGAQRAGGVRVHLLSALDTGTGIVLAQVVVDAKSNEIPAFTPLLDAIEAVLGSLDSVIFVADALHTQTGHAREIASRGAHLLIPAKGNQCAVVARPTPWPALGRGSGRGPQS